jgi:hypothetical protein
MTPRVSRRRNARQIRRRLFIIKNAQTADRCDNRRAVSSGMSRKAMRYALAASVALTTGIVYLSSLANSFVDWDDFLYIVDNPHIRSLDGSFFRWAFFEFYSANWHPLTWLSHGLDYAFWGLNPLGHHLTNVILHSLNTFLVVALVMRLIEGNTIRRPTPPTRAGDSGEGEGENPSHTSHNARFTLIAAGVTGLLFGLHPLHVESVAWVSERKDLLCALFALLSLTMYTTYATHKTYRPYLLSFMFFALALLSKPMAVSLPVVFLILDWFPFGRCGSLRDLRRVFPEKLPFIVLSIASSIVTVFAQKAGSTIVPVEAVPLSLRASVACRSLCVYLEKMLFPVNLSPFYPYPERTSFFSPLSLLPVLLIVAVTIVFTVRAKHQKILLAVWCYYLITLFPVLGILQVGAQARADRYTYLPSLAPFLLAGLAAAWGIEKAALAARGPLGRLALPMIMSFVLATLAYLTVGEIHIWRNSYTLWNYVVERGPDAPIAFNGRAVAFY